VHAAKVHPHTRARTHTHTEYKTEYKMHVKYVHKKTKKIFFLNLVKFCLINRITKSTIRGTVVCFCRDWITKRSTAANRRSLCLYRWTFLWRCSRNPLSWKPSQLVRRRTVPSAVQQLSSPQDFHCRHCPTLPFDPHDVEHHLFSNFHLFDDYL